MRRKKIIRLFITAFSIIALLIIILLIFSYIKNIALPAKVKAAVINSITRETTKFTSIDDVYFIPFKGIIMKNLKIYESEEKKETLFEAEEIAFNCLLLPFFKRKFIIPALYINNMKLNIKNEPMGGEWNISALKCFKKSEISRLKKEYPLIVYKIIFNNGKLYFTDNTISPAFSKEINLVYANLTLLPIKAKFMIKATLEQHKKSLSLVLRGGYQFRRKELKLNLKTKNFPIQELEPYYKNSMPIQMQNVLADGDLNLILKDTKELWLSGNCSIFDEVISIKASIINLETAPLLKAEFASDVRLKNIEPVIEGLLPKKTQKKFEVEGDASFTSKITDVLNDELRPEFSSRVKIQNASIRTPLSHVIKNINGALEIKNEFITTRDFKLYFMNQDYSLDGTLKGFQNPDIDISLKSEEFSLATRFSIVDRDAHIKKAKVAYRGLNVSFSGEVYEIDNPSLHLYGNTTFLLKDIKPFISEKLEFLKHINFSGRCKGEIFISGRPAVPHLLEVGLKLSSDEITIEDFIAQNFNMKIMSKDGKASIKNLTLEPYGGTLYITTTLDLEKDKIPYELMGHLRDVQIEKLIRHTALKNSGVYGRLNSSVNMAGIIDDLDSIKGEGWIHIKDAHLGPLPIFIPVMNNLVDFFRSRLPGYERIMLKEATATLTIAERKIATNDFILWGDEASVLYDGYIDFDGNLDFRIENNFAEGLVSDKTSVGKSLSAFITEMGRFISEARLTGTIKEPKYEFKPLPLDKFFKEKFKDIFQGIFR